MWKTFLIDIWKYLIAFQFGELLAKELGIALVNSFGTGHDVSEAPDDEHQSGHRPAEDGEAYPFHEFAEIVGRTHLLEGPAVGDIVVVVVFIYSQGADDAVGRQVDGHPQEEEDGADDELRRPEPADGIVVGGREVEQPAALHQGVAGVEEHTHYDDGDGHLAGTLHQRGEDDGAL